ncbi:maestro heat-like repeat-containing protein family member 2B [Pogona vitticeps]
MMEAMLVDSQDSVGVLAEKEKEVLSQGPAMNAIQHLNASAPGMNKVPWPKLLSLVVGEGSAPALTPLCRRLKELAALRPEGSRLHLGSCQGGVTLPSPQQLLARLLVSAAPRSRRGFWALQLLHALRADVHEAVVQLWAEEIPDIWGFCQAEGPRASQPEWEQKLLQLLNKTLKRIEDDGWTQDVIINLEEQRPSYTDGSREKSFLYKALGVSLACCEDRAFVQGRLKELVEKSDFREAAQIEKVAKILSFSAAGHLGLTLATLEDCTAGMAAQNSGQRQLHQALVFIYGQIALQAPKESLLLEAGTGILRRALGHYRASCQLLGVTAENKGTHTELTFCKSVTDICNAVHEAQNASFRLACKEEILDTLLGFLERKRFFETALCPRAITAVVSVSQLKPCLPAEDLRGLLALVTRCLFPLPPLERLKKRARTEQEASVVEIKYTRSMEAMGKLIQVLVKEDPSSERTEEMIQVMEPWLTRSEWIRERALQASCQVLAAFQVTAGLPEGENLKAYGGRVVFLAPYTWESSIECRRWAAKGISHLVHIQGRSRITEEEEKELDSALCDLQAEVPADLTEASATLAKVVSTHLPEDQVLDFAEALLKDLASRIPICPTAGGCWLPALVQNRGDTIKSQIPGLLDLFSSHLPATTQYGLEEVLMEAIFTLAHQHLDTVVSHLLRQPLPLASGTSRIWRHLGEDPSLALLILPKLLSFMTRPSILGTISSSGREELEEVVEVKHLKATCAMYEVLLGLHMEVMVWNAFPQLLYSLPEQVKSWCSFGDPATYPEGLRMLTWCLLQTGMLEGVLIQRVLPWMKSGSSNLRLLGTTILTEVIPLCSKERIQLRAFLPVLKERAEDQQPDIRLMALRSLGRLLFWAPVEVRGQKKVILQVLCGHLHDAPVVAEVLDTLALVLQHLRWGKVASVFKDICRNVTVFLSDEDDHVRGAAFHLFAVLATRAKQQCPAFFAEQVKQNLAPLLVHQSDCNRKVSEACRVAFSHALDFVAEKRLRHLCKTTNISSTKITVDLCQHLVKESPKRSVDLLRKTAAYFSSGQDEVRMKALEISGALLQSIPVTGIEDETLHLLLTGLEALRERAGPNLPRAAAATGALEATILKKKDDLLQATTSTAPKGRTWRKRLLFWRRD